MVSTSAGQLQPISFSPSEGPPPPPSGPGVGATADWIHLGDPLPVSPHIPTIFVQHPHPRSSGPAVLLVPISAISLSWPCPQGHGSPATVFWLLPTVTQAAPMSSPVPGIMSPSHQPTSNHHDQHGQGFPQIFPPAENLKPLCLNSPQTSGPSVHGALGAVWALSPAFSPSASSSPGLLPSSATSCDPPRAACPTST